VTSTKTRKLRAAILIAMTLFLCSFGHTAPPSASLQPAVQRSAGPDLAPLADLPEYLADPRRRRQRPPSSSESMKRVDQARLPLRVHPRRRRRRSPRREEYGEDQGAHWRLTRMLSRC
jgi:hypothetical protein